MFRLPVLSLRYYHSEKNLNQTDMGITCQYAFPKIGLTTAVILTVCRTSVIVLVIMGNDLASLKSLSILFICAN